MDILPIELITEVSFYLDEDDIKNFIIVFPQLDTEYYWNQYIEMRTGHQSVVKYLKVMTRSEYYIHIIKKIKDINKGVFTLDSQGTLYGVSVRLLKNTNIFKDTLNKFIVLHTTWYPHIKFNIDIDANHSIIYFKIENTTMSIYYDATPASTDNPKNIYVNNFRHVTVYSFVNEVTIEGDADELLKEIWYRQYDI